LQRERRHQLTAGWENASKQRLQDEKQEKQKELDLTSTGDLLKIYQTEEWYGEYDPEYDLSDGRIRDWLKDSGEKDWRKIMAVRKLQKSMHIKDTGNWGIGRLRFAKVTKEW
jgi:hypothetical protein